MAVFPVLYSISLCALRCVWLCDPMDCVDRQASLSVGFYRQEYWSGLPFPPLGICPTRVKPAPAASPVLAVGFCATAATWEALKLIYSIHRVVCGVPKWPSDKEPACQCRRHESGVRFLGRADPLEEGMASHSNTLLACRIPRTEEPGWLQSIGSQRVGLHWSDLAHTHMLSRLCLEGKLCFLQIEMVVGSRCTLELDKIKTWTTLVLF